MKSFKPLFKNCSSSVGKGIKMKKNGNKKKVLGEERKKRVESFVLVFVFSTFAAIGLFGAKR